MQVKDIMTSPVLSVEPETAVLEAVGVMLQRRISGLPVIDTKGHLVGIVTEGDFLRRAETGTERQRPRWLEFLIGPGRLADEYRRTHGRKVGDIMTPDPVTVSEDAALDEVVTLMEKRRIKRLPVMRGETVVGIVSRTNLVHALAALARRIEPTDTDDRAIRERVLAELAAQPWAPTALIDVTVDNGVVDLWGTITDERERSAMVIAAENVPGVKSVNDHLAWIDPMSGMVLIQPGEETAPVWAS